MSTSTNIRRRRTSSQDIEEFEVTTNEGRLLVQILKSLRVANKTIEALLPEFESQVDRFRANPDDLFYLLRAVGIPADKAHYVVRRFREALYGRPSFSYVTTEVPQPPTMMGMVNSPIMEEIDRKQFFKQMREFMENFMYAMLVQTITSLVNTRTNTQQTVPQTFGVMMYEPIVDSKGNIVTDKLGRPLYRVIVNPIPSIMGERDDSKWIEVLKSLLEFEIKRLEGESKEKEELRKQLEEERKRYVESFLKELRDRLDSLSNRNPIKEVMEILRDMRGLKDVVEPKVTSPEVARTLLELEKWKHEKDLEMQKFLAQMSVQRLEHERSIRTMERITETIQEIGKELATPIGKAIAEGIRAGILKKLGEGLTGQSQRMSSKGQGSRSVGEVKIEERERSGRGKTGTAPSLNVNVNPENLKDVRDQLLFKVKKLEELLK